MKTRLLLQLSFILAMAVMGCKKKDTTPQVDIDPALNKYAFKTGSYWVYQKENSTVLDSEYITSVTTGNSQYPEPTGGGRALYPYIAMHFAHQVQDNSSPMFADILSLQDKYIQFGINPVPFYQVERVYFVNNNKGDSTNYSEATGAPALTLVVVSHSDTATVHGHTFSSVDKILEKANNQPIAYYYWTPEAGLIRIERLTTSSGTSTQVNWNLVRWKTLY